jgi:aminopeptidase N
MNRILFVALFFLANWTLFAQQTQAVDFKKATVDVVLNPANKEVGVDVLYEFEILKDVDSIYFDMQTLDTYRIYQQSFKSKNSYQNKKIVLKNRFKKGEKHTVGLTAFTNPAKAMYFIDWKETKGKKQIWTQGQGKYTSSWLPSFDDVNEKVEFDFSITFDKDYEVIANGKLLKKESPNDSLTKWYFDMKQPMSSYLAAIAVGKYEKKTITSKSGVPIELYYYPEDEANFEPTYRHTQQIFDFLEVEIGVAYPWQNYKQIPVKDFLYAGMENTGTTIFSDTFVVDSIGFKDKNYVNVNAHELAHQWFGNLVTAKSGKHHWLQEGFATYYALLAEKEIFGDDYFYWQLYKSAMQLQALNDGKGEAVLNPKASSLTFYQKGAWALHVLRTKVGDKAFKNAVKRYLNTYKFSSATTEDFIKIVAEESNQNLDAFVQMWLVNPQLPEEFFDERDLYTLSDVPKIHLYQYLPSIQNVLVQINGIERMIEQDNFAGTFDIKLPADSSIKIELPYGDEQFMIRIVELLKENIHDNPTAVLRNLFKINSIRIRQAIAQNLTKIPVELKADYESLLNDASYVTKEAALYNLWVNFPSDRKTYLDATKDVMGFNDKSLRILWLTLAMVTKEYSGKNTPFYFQELSNYTQAYNHFEVRQNAFVYLNELKAFTDQNLADLVNGAMHHNWRFSKFCRDLLDSIIKNPSYQENLQRVSTLLSTKEKNFLKQRMEK